MPEQSAQTVADTLVAPWVFLLGDSCRWLTDQGANFETPTEQNLCTIGNIDKIRTTGYHPAYNGACARLKQTIQRGLQKMLTEKRMEESDVVLSEVMFANNTSVHSTPVFTPNFLMFGV